jgi:hypothetical protein
LGGDAPELRVKARENLWKVQRELVDLFRLIASHSLPHVERRSIVPVCCRKLTCLKEGFLVNGKLILAGRAAPIGDLEPKK